MLANLAKKHRKWLIGGSIPEKDINSNNNLYNTCLIFNPQGHLIAKHRKIHLFDIDVPGKITFKESDSLSAGVTPTHFTTPWGKIGVGICYDIRFPEYAMLLRQEYEVDMIVYPGAFNLITGPSHWELLQRARAVDNQVYVFTCSPARDAESTGYQAYGFSSIISPWGDVLAQADEKEGIITQTIKLKKIQEMRSSIPCWQQKRHDIYEVINKQG